MLLYRPLMPVLLLLLSSLTSLSVYAASSEECCMRLFNGDFLPLACGKFLGDSVLTLPERMVMGIPPVMCNSIGPPTPEPFPMFAVPPMMEIPPMIEMPWMFGPMYF